MQNNSNRIRCTIGSDHISFLELFVCIFKHPVSKSEGNNVTVTITAVLDPNTSAQQESRKEPDLYKSSELSGVLVAVSYKTNISMQLEVSGGRRHVKFGSNANQKIVVKKYRCTQCNNCMNDKEFKTQLFFPFPNTLTATKVF